MIWFKFMLFESEGKILDKEKSEYDLMLSTPSAMVEKESQYLSLFF